jgi:Ca2+-binding RTX toxin-like protein
MAVNILSADSTTQWIANTSGDTYLLQQDVYLAVLGTAITGTAAVTNRKFLIDGHVVGEGGGSGMFIGQDAANGGSNTILIGASGSVLGEAYGIVSHGGDLNFINMGSVTGDTAGLFLSGSNNAVLNQGTILSYDGTGIDSQGAFVEIANNGAVMGETCGVLLAGAVSTLINNGSIDSSDNSFSTTGVHITGGNSTFINNGTVSTNGGRVILGGDSSEGVVNHGSIYGYVDLGVGSDTFINDGGSVFGIVDLGDGDDTFSSRNGYFSGSVTGGDGNDQYYLYDALTTIIEEEFGNGGSDTVHAFVSYSLGDNFEGLVLEGGADLVGRGNVLANLMTGNSGDNKLFGRGGNDGFFASDGSDVHNGGAGTDLITYANYFDAGGVIVNLATGKGGAGAAGHVFVSIENVVGTEFKDRLVGNAASNRIDGNYGNDILSGGGAKDTFIFKGGNDIDTITDFQDKADRIELQYHVNAFNADSFADIKDFISQKGNDAVIDFSSVNAGDKLVLKNMDASDLSAADFLFI